MSSTLTQSHPATTPTQRPSPPARLHHYNFCTEDLEATRAFYEDIAGLTLRAFWIEPVPEGQGSQQIGHAFFGLANDAMLAFMHYSEPAIQATMVGTEQPSSVHIALKVDDAQQRQIRHNVEEAGFEHFYIDHGVLRSLYVYDPNRLLVEFAVDPDGYEQMYEMEAQRAHATMRDYLAGHRTPTIPEKTY